MKTLVIKIELGNSAFDPEPDVEIVRLLDCIREKVAVLKYGLRLYDRNGNHCGTARIRE